MRHEKLISLLKQKESKRLEFKKFRDEISATLFETVCAFLNRDGGEIIIGADDDGNIIGIEESRIDRMMN
ncbi:MAG: ATP-binding protein, partial [Candidatus Delongbacteria bacterium]|nr:ATP-binding protein [Candidatus Delongbacteria bacterium]